MCDLSLHKTKRHFHYSQIHNTHRLHQQMSAAIQLRENVFEIKDLFEVSEKKCKIVQCKRTNNALTYIIA
jgi:hypothetical protein